MRPKNPSTQGTSSPLLSVLAVALLLLIAVPTFGSVALADTTQNGDTLENPVENTIEAGDGELTEKQAALGSSPIQFDHNEESQITVGGDESQVFRVIKAEMNATRVVENKSVRMTVIVDNTGVETKTQFLNIVSTPSSNVEVEPASYTAQVEAGGQQKFAYNITFNEEGDYTLGVSNTDIQKDVEVVNKSSSVYDGDIKSAVERQSVSKVVSSYKDEINGSSHPAYNPSIPPVVESANGTFVNSAVGEIYDFGDAQRADNNASLTLDGNETAGELIVGTAFENVPNQDHYNVQLNYDIDPDTSAPAEDRNIEVQVVRQDGSVIDTSTKYMLDANTSTTGRETRYFSLSNEEIDYVQNNKNIYLVFTSDSAPEVDIYYNRVISSNKVLETTSGRTQVAGLETKAQGEPGTETNFNAYEPIVIEITKENNGNSVVERDILLQEEGETIDSKTVTLNPGETKTETFVTYRETGYYTYSSEGFGSTQVTVGDPTGNANEPPIARIDTDIPRINDAYVPSGDTASDDTSETFSLDGSISSDPNGDSLDYSWRIDGTEVSTNPSISSSEFNTDGTKQVELIVSDGTNESVARMTVSINDMAPTSQFTANPSSAPLNVPVQFDATDAQDSDGNIMSYEWTVEGTTVQNSSTPFLEYTFNTLGTKSITLKTVDDDGNTNTRSQTIEVYEANVTPQFTADPSNPRVNADVEFDASNSTTDDGTITEYNWYNGDGEQIGTGEFMTHQFSEQGSQSVELEVKTSEGSSGSITRTYDVSPPFQAVASVDSGEKEIGQTFYFNSYSSEDPENTITEYEWTMGDGRNYTGQEVFHQYEEPGTYDVTLTVKGDGYSDSDTIQVTVTSTPPDAVAQFNTSTFLANTVEVYGGSSEQPGGYITGYYWEFGDGYTTNGETAQHRYSNPTNNTDTDTPLREPYNVTLTVTGEYGTTDTDSVRVEVKNRGPYNDYTVEKNASDRNENTGSDYSEWVSNEFTFNGSPSYHFEDPVGDITTYRWEFTRPDGTQFTRTGERVDQQFSQLGEYTVKYAIKDEWGYWNNTTFTMDIDSRPPKASFVFSPQEPGPSEPVNYDASSTAHNEPVGEIQSYEWNFDDGSGNHSGETITHTFQDQSKSNYVATLTVTDQFGKSDTVSKTIVTDPYESCHDLLMNRENANSGMYPIDPNGNDNTFEVYCQMSYDGGGWTVIDKDTAWDFYNRVGGSTVTNGNIISWGIGPNEVYSVDGNGDHSFVYKWDTGFTYTQIRPVGYKLGATSYRTGGSTSEMRGSNTALSNWDGLNSGGVSGDGGFGTKNSVLDSYNNAYNGQCPNGHSWPTCGQYHGDSGINYPTGGTPEFWDNGDVYNKQASSVAVGWGESGGQDEGWEWEKGSFWVREPVGALTYYYENGANNYNFQQSANSGSINYNSDHISLYSNGGDTAVTTGQTVDLSQYDEIVIDYILTVDNGGSGYVQLEVAGRTASDSINQNYLVNDGSVSIDVSDLSGTATVTVTSHASNSDTTVEVNRVWGRQST